MSIPLTWEAMTMFRLLASVFKRLADPGWDDDDGSDPLAAEDPDDFWSPAV